MAAPPGPAGRPPTELLERRPDLRSAEQELVAETASSARRGAPLPAHRPDRLFGLRSTDLGTCSRRPRRRVASPPACSSRSSTPAGTAGAWSRGVARMRIAMDSTGWWCSRRSARSRTRSSTTRRTEQRASRPRGSGRATVLSLAETRYVGGVGTYLEVLDAQRALFDAELEEAQDRRAAGRARVVYSRSAAAGRPGRAGPRPRRRRRRRRPRAEDSTTSARPTSRDVTAPWPGSATRATDASIDHRSSSGS